MIPSKNKLNNLKIKIIKKLYTFNTFIKSIDEWQLELNKIIERIRQYLNNEFRIIEKFF